MEAWAQTAAGERYTDASQLSRRLVTLHEHERRDLAEVLHEIVAPNLASLMLYLRIVEDELPRDLPAHIRARIADAQALLMDTDATLQVLGADLHSVVLDRAGLEPALGSYGHQFSRRTGIAFRLVGTPGDKRLPVEVESALFRIAQEALANCARHSAAHTVTIELAHDARHVLMTITDDGVGFDRRRLDNIDRPSPGLLAMRQRAEFVDARWDLESHPGQGTRITVALCMRSTR